MDEMSSEFHKFNLETNTFAWSPCTCWARVVLDIKKTKAKHRPTSPSD